MKRFVTSALLLALLATLVLPVSSLAAGMKPAAAPQTYTVKVGWENDHTGIELLDNYPGTVTIHEGDTVRWIANSKEVHTVTFGYEFDATLPAFIIPAAPDYPEGPSGLLINPLASDRVMPADGMYTGGFANSGVMAVDPPAYQEFSLTFPEAGTYVYVCLVHGWVMNGTVEVMPADEPVPTPGQSMALGNKEIARDLAQVPAVVRAAEMQIQPPTENADGTLNHTVMVGYNAGEIDLLRFFPDKLNVRPGDTVTWILSPEYDVAPHTVTFLNGAEPEGFAVPFDGHFYANPAVFFPYQPGPVLTREGIYNSGVMEPIPGMNSYTLTIGDMTPGPQRFVCLLHLLAGMKGTLTVLPR